MAFEVAQHPMAQLAKACLVPIYPLYFPVNWVDCLTAMSAHSFIPAVVLVGKEEDRDRLIADTIQWFDEEEAVREFLSMLAESRLRHLAQRVRARTNLLATMGRPLMRSARAELFHEYPRKSGGLWAGLGPCLDDGFRLVLRQYNGGRLEEFY